MISRPHVALLIETSKQYGRGLITGIGQYIKSYGPWSVFIEERGLEAPLPRWLKKWKGNGIIARVHNDAMANALRNTGIPVINVRRFHTTVAMPAVWEDDAHLCRLALSHFTEHGFRNFAYCGWPHIQWASQRGMLFCDAVREGGFGQCQLYQPSRKGPRDWEEEQDEVGEWLRSLPKPVGVLAANDVRGVQVLDACQRIDLPVPEQCAVLGVDNEIPFCELASPSLSSIDQDEERTGYEAARLLDQLMAGEKPPPGPVLVPALGVVARASTDSIAVEDADLAKALRFLRLHACDQISIRDVAAHANMSSRALQRRFKAAMGCTPLEAKFNIQLQRIRQMLGKTDLKLQVIAKRSGFRYVGHMSSFFKEHTGITPGQYRSQNRDIHLPGEALGGG